MHAPPLSRNAFNPATLFSPYSQDLQRSQFLPAVWQLARESILAQVDDCGLRQIGPASGNGASNGGGASN